MLFVWGGWGLVPRSEGAPGKRRKPGQKLRKGMSQWSTLESGPLASRKKAETGAKAPKWREPVVHFGEWSTGFPEKGRIWANPPKKRELVVHSGEWTTSYPENGGIPGKTSEKARASGPLWKVDHWLPRKWRNSGQLLRKGTS